MNLASALTDGFAKDIGVDQNTINLGNQLMFLGIVALEIPSNIVLQRLGPRKWISAQVFIFGAVATLQVFVRDKTGFLVARSFLGLREAGYIPGGIYTLSTWYTKRELAKRVAVFFFGMFGGNAISPVLASGILQLRGRGNLKGWQWLFLSKSDPCHNEQRLIEPQSKVSLQWLSQLRFSFSSREVLMSRDLCCLLV